MPTMKQGVEGSLLRMNGADIQPQGWGWTGKWGDGGTFKIVFPSKRQPPSSQERECRPHDAHLIIFLKKLEIWIFLYDTIFNVGKLFKKNGKTVWPDCAVLSKSTLGSDVTSRCNGIPGLIGPTQ